MRFAPFVLALLLAGCAAPPASNPQGWSGKLGYQVEAGVGQRAQAGSALFELQGDARAGSLTLNSPLGTALAQARWDPHGVWFEDRQGPRAYPDVDSLAQALGEALQGPPLPLLALFDWLRGEPSPQAPHRAIEGGFEQQGWTLRREDATHLLVTRPAENGNGAIKLRIVITP